MKKMIIYRGRPMIKGWDKRIEEAQKILSYKIEGKVYPRIPYHEDELGHAPNRPEYPSEPPSHCHDCGILFGELHVPNCDMERCPKCGGQAISCDCRIEGLGAHKMTCHLFMGKIKPSHN